MAETTRRAGIIGGGIGGLAAAIALRQSGWDVTVYEQSAEFREVGAGIGLSANGLAALDALGVGESIRAEVIPDRAAGVRNHRGRNLVSARLGDLAGSDLAIVHRAELIAALHSALPEHCLRAGWQVRAVNEAGVVETANGATQYNLVVAADGIRSIARRQLWPDHAKVHNTGVAAWRWIVDAPAPDFIGQIWGDRSEMGVFPMSGNRTYVWAAGRPGIDLPHFADWADPIPGLIAAAERVIEDDLMFVRVPAHLARGRVVLLGDAAHAMPPTVGQGAALALEDAVTLGVHAPNLAAYSEARLRRVRTLNWLSRAAVPVMDPRWRAIAAVRDSAAILTPNRLAVWATRVGFERMVTNWQPPRRLEAAEPI